MTPLGRALTDLEADLSGLGIPHALIGGLAVGARTEPRFTRDADFAVAVTDDKAAERVVRDLSARGYRTVTVLEQDALGRLSTVRLAPRAPESRGLLLDLLFASSGIEPEIVAAAESLEVLGVRMPVAAIGHLIALKILSRNDDQRPQDLVDLKGLVRVASPPDLATARRSLDLITKRGFNRGRDLVSAADQVLPK